jgi:hypothetical protein
MKRITTGTEAGHHNVASRFHGRGVYHRFNVDHGLQEVRLFDHYKCESIEADTETYLRKYEVEKRLDDAVEKMKEVWGGNVKEGMFPVCIPVERKKDSLQARLQRLGSRN